MAKHIHVIVDDELHAELSRAKGDADWRDLLVDGARANGAEVSH